MRNLLRIAIGAGLFSITLSAGTVGFSVTALGGNNFRYLYDFTALSLQANQEVDIRFSPTLYSTLTNGVAGPGFSLAVFQPNNPPGSFGDYSALSLVNNPSLTGPFRVDFAFLGTGTPGPQPFLINQYDSAGNFISTIDSGNTTPPPGTVPEPATWMLAVGGLLFAGVAKSARRWWSLREDL